MDGHAASLAVAAAVLTVVALVLGTGIRLYPAFADDEGTYTAQAWAVQAHGAMAHYTYWYDHPPLGWLQLAGVSWLLGPLLRSGSAVGDARSVVLLPALASAALLYVLARRLCLRRAFAALAVLLFALSPLAVTSLRQVLLDNLATPWILGAFVLAASPGRRLWAYAASGACFAIAVLTKETSLLLLPGLVLAVRHGVDQRTRAFCVAAFTTLLALTAAAYPLYAMLKGELLPGAGHVSLLEAVKFQLYARPSTGSALAPGSQSHELVASWLRIDPWLLGLGVLALPAALWIRRLRPVAVSLLVLIVMGLRPGYLPQPYVIALLPFCALVVAGTLDTLWDRVQTKPVAWRRGAAAAAALVAFVAFGRDWWSADSYAMRTDQTGPAIAAQRWVERNVDHRARVLVDDTFYVDLVDAGFAPRFGAVWFYKLDFTTNLDPSIVRTLPQGWKAFDYVISTDVIRSALAQSPSRLVEVRRALRNSTPVKTFGTGAGRVEIRRITGVGTGSGLLPPAPPASSTSPSWNVAPEALLPPAPKPARPAHRARHPRAARHHRRHRRAR